MISSIAIQRAAAMLTVVAFFCMTPFASAQDAEKEAAAAAAAAETVKPDETGDEPKNEQEAAAAAAAAAATVKPDETGDEPKDEQEAAAAAAAATEKPDETGDKPKDEQDAAESVSELIRAGKLDEAKTLLEETLAATAGIELPDGSTPEVLKLYRMRQLLASRYSAARDYESALEQTRAVFEYHLANLNDQPATAREITAYAQQIYSYAMRTDNIDVAVDTTDRTIAEIERLLDRDQQLWGALTRMVNVKAAILSNQGETEQAAALNEAHLQRLADLDASDQADEQTAEWYAQMLSTVTSRESDAEKKATRRQELDDYVQAAMEKYPESGSIQNLYASIQYAQVVGTYRDDPEGAQARIDATMEKLEGAAEDNSALKGTLTRLKSYERRIEAALKVARMIGQPAPPLQIHGWANTEEFTEDSLAGKVVLYDFWAVWCGPCIRTFPHLREWQAEFGDQGFQVVGITRYYKYEWDAEADKAVRSKEEVDPEIEHEAVANFMQSHDLTHPTIFVPTDSTLHSEYGVTGIPHAVLIDRRGRVQMVKVGSGDANAEALHAKIKELIAE